MKKMKKNYRSLNKKIAGIVGSLIFVLLMFMDVLSLVSVQKSNNSSFESSCLSITKAYSAYLQSTNSSYMQQIRIYTTSEEIKSADKKRQVAFIKASAPQRSKDFAWAAYVDPNGIGYFDNGHVENLSRRDFCIAMNTEKKNQAYGTPFQTNDTTEYVVPIAKSYTRNNETGFILVGVPLSVYQNKIMNISLNGKGFAFLLSGQGDIMAHTDSRQIMKTKCTDADKMGYENLSAIARNMISGTELNTGTAWFKDFHGEEYLSAYSPISGTDWALGLAITKKDVYAAAYKLGIDIAINSLLIALILVIAISFIVKQTIKPLKKVGNAIQEIASGDADLTKRLKTRERNEIGSLTDGFNDFMDTLHGTMKDLKISNTTLIDAGSELKESSYQTSSAIAQINANIENVTAQISKQTSSVEETASTVEQIAQNINSLERMIENQAAGVEEASASVEQMIINISDVNKSVERVAYTFNDLENKALKGSQMQKAVNDRITQIEKQSDMLKSANAAIADIAAQTNLLAMNAAIEAAHAGEAGKGFSVVADEIRKLSETSREQSKTIGEQLKYIQNSIVDVGQASNLTSKTFSVVAQTIKETNFLIQNIKNAMDEQNEGSKQISKALVQMNGSTVEVRNASEEMTTGNLTILQEIKHLQDVTGNLKTFVSEMDLGAQNINNSSATLSEVSDKMQAVIIDIGEKINCFNT